MNGSSLMNRALLRALLTKLVEKDVSLPLII